LNNNQDSMKFIYPLIHGHLVKRYKRSQTKNSIYLGDDPAYGKALDEAIRNGVELFVVQARITSESIEYYGTLPVEM